MEATPSGADVGTARQPGRRERKKQQTRKALIAAALELFDRTGFDGTTIDQIADAVDVSPRTFFRYFTSKEDVVLGGLDDQYTAIFEAFEQRPKDEPVLTALRHAAHTVARRWETGESEFDHSRFGCVVRLKVGSPNLAARGAEQARARLVELAALIARRMGVDAATDPRPTLVASVSLCAVTTAIEAWRTIKPDASPSDLVDQTLGLIEQGINYPSSH